jgi:hypothetical protein
MHQLDNRTYAGAPGETVTVSTTVAGGGAVTVTLDGHPVDEDPTFRLKLNSGDETHMHVLLVGAAGDSCVVRISDVDGGSDGDLLLCQTLDPAPIHRYRFIATAREAMTALGRARSGRGARKAMSRKRRASRKTR